MSQTRLLLVDDDTNIRIIAEMSLEDDFEVFTAQSGKEALDLAQTERPQVILLDMMMPVMDGLTTLSKLREMESTKHIPVIFMTAKVQAHEMQDYVDKGAIGVIMKPFDPLTLSRTVMDLIGTAKDPR